MAREEADVAAMQNICPNCMGQNSEMAHLCRFCMTPLTSHAAIDPIFSIAAQADTFGKAANSPRKLIIVIGMWLILGPILVVCSLGGLSLLAMLIRGGALAGVIPMMSRLAIVGVIAFISGILLWRTTVGYLRTKPEEQELERGMEGPEEDHEENWRGEAEADEDRQDDAPWNAEEDGEPDKGGKST